MTTPNQDEILPVISQAASETNHHTGNSTTRGFEPFTLEPITSKELREEPERAKFNYSINHLRRLVAARHHAALSIFGGVEGLAAGLRTNLHTGLSIDEDVITETIVLGYPIRDPSEASSSNSESPPATIGTAEHDSCSPGGFTSRRAYFGENRVPRKKPTTFLQLLWLAFNDKLMFLLTGSAAVSLALGIYQTIHPSEERARVEWVEGLAILVAVIVIVFATALNDWQKNAKFQKLNQKKEERIITVIRSGKTCSISVFDLCVGDILHVEAGDVLPADCILIESSAVQCDESSLTGESEFVKKGPSYQEHADHFLLSGTKVVAGVGSCLVVAVGANSTYGRVLMSLDNSVEETPLQQKLGRLAKYIINLGLVVGIAFFIIQFSRFLARLETIEGGAKAKGQAFLEVLILAITLIVIVVPEGLPLTVTISLAFATTRMLRDKNLVRSLRSCETMGNATTVCSDKTGTLTQNKMRVVTGVIGASTTFGETYSPLTCDRESTNLPVNDLTTTFPVEIVEILKQSTAVNSTAMETDIPGEFIGSSTESSLLKFAQCSLGMGSVGSERMQTNVIRMVPFDSRRKWMAVIIRLGPSQFRLLVKGAAEVLLDMCNSSLKDPVQGLIPTPLLSEDTNRLSSTISQYSQSLLRVVAAAYKDLNNSQIEELSNLSDTALTSSLSSLTLLGIFGIRDPLRPNVAESVRQCQAAGVFVRMVTGDNFNTAKSIASECHIYTPGGIALDGPTFRRLSTEQLSAIAPRIQVLARSSPEDKERLVSHLKALDEVVAVTGDGTNDALALKTADIGFSMGISGTEVAKEASNIILMDDNFASIVKAISWGRAVNDATKKFLQYQFTINITAGLLTIITALIGGSEDSVFTVVQLLWINLLMDTFASLALSTDYPTQSSLNRLPEPRNASILNTTMWKMIGGQSLYQAAVMFTLHYAGNDLFGAVTDEEQRRVQTMTFNAYVWMQFFNQFNCRRADNHLNIFEGLGRNPWFFFVQAITLGGQIAIVFIGGQAFQTSQLSGAMWGWSILFGFLTLPIGIILRCIPDGILYAICSTVFSILKRIVCCSRRPIDHPAEGRSRYVRIKDRVMKTLRVKGQAQGFLENAESTTTDRQKQTPQSVDSPFILEEAIEAARYGSTGGLGGLEVHPETVKDDPVIVLQNRSAGFPPSQDPSMRRFMGL